MTNFSENATKIANLTNIEMAQMELICDENDKEIIKFLNENEEIYMDFDFMTEIASVNIESSLITETSPNFEPSGSNFETNMEQQKLWERQISELSSIIANYDPTKPAPPLSNVRC